MTSKVYRPPASVAMRGMGVGAVGIGASVVGVSVVAAVDLSGGFEAALLVLLGIVALAALVVLVVGVVRALGWGTRLVLDDEGFLNATGPGAGVRRGAWRDVRKVQADGPVVSVDLSGSRQSIIRTSSLDVDPRSLAREFRSRLNQDRGYRPISAKRRADDS